MSTPRRTECLARASHKLRGGGPTCRLWSLESAKRVTDRRSALVAVLPRWEKRRVAQGVNDNPRRVGEADFFSRYAVKLVPQDAEVARIRVEIEDQIRRQPKP